MSSISQTINALGVGRIVALAAVGLAVMAFFFYVITRITSPQMALLYGDLEAADSSQIISRLESMGIEYRIGNDASQIYVAADNVLRLRMTMAEDGIPSGGSVGYEIFDRSSGMGSSNFVQSINRLRALEGELARSIRSMNQVKAARVHLVLPQRQLFSRSAPEPSASIALQLNGNATLSREQVAAIQYLVSAAVPGLKPGNVSIVDSRGSLLARGGGGEDSDRLGATSTEEIRQSHEHRIAGAIEELLERSLGHGTVRAEVSADIDFDRISTSEEIFDPDSQVVRSTQTVEERNASTDGERTSTPVTVAEELPTTEAEPAESGSNSSASANRTEETVNYEISKVVRKHVREAGLVRKLSVAVLVDGTYSEPDADGIRNYAPRTEDEITQINALVRSAIGFDEQRGDSVEVVNMRFAQPTQLEGTDEEAANPLLDLSKNDYFRIGEVLVLLIVAALAILFVVRPLVKRLLEFSPKPAGTTPQITDNSAQALAAPDQSREGPSSLIDIDQVEGRVKESSLKKVAEIVQNHPGESVAILRSWMFNEG